jgi:phage baseplate assembly protein V
LCCRVFIPTTTRAVGLGGCLALISRRCRYEYEPETGALTVTGIKTADVTASDSVAVSVPVVLVKAETRVTLDTPEVVCTNKLTTGTLEVKQGEDVR